ncbi:MAG: hypothetical protein HC794_03565 [Nitrospiraceae bacterium]|nr:hypothetical protein [Nitrospiraceae bacterium]
MWASIIFSMGAVVLTLFTFSTTRERAAARDGPSSSVREDVSALLTNSSWVVLTIGGVLLVVGLGTRLGSLALYLKYFMIGGPADAGGPVFLWMDRFSVFITLGVIGQILGTLSAPSLTRRFGKIRLMIGVNAVHGALLIGSYFPCPRSVRVCARAARAGHDDLRRRPDDPVLDVHRLRPVRRVADRAKHCRPDGFQLDVHP